MILWFDSHIFAKYLIRFLKHWVMACAGYVSVLRRNMEDFSSRIRDFAVYYWDLWEEQQIRFPAKHLHHLAFKVSDFLRYIVEI